MAAGKEPLWMWLMLWCTLKWFWKFIEFVKEVLCTLCMRCKQRTGRTFRKQHSKHSTSQNHWRWKCTTWILAVAGISKTSRPTWQSRLWWSPYSSKVGAHCRSLYVTGSNWKCSTRGEWFFCKRGQRTTNQSYSIHYPSKVWRTFIKQWHYVVEIETPCSNHKKCSTNLFTSKKIQKKPFWWWWMCYYGMGS